MYYQGLKAITNPTFGLVEPTLVEPTPVVGMFVSWQGPFTSVPNSPKTYTTTHHTTEFPSPQHTNAFHPGPGGARSFVGRRAALDHAAVPAAAASRGEPERGPDECERRSGDAAVVFRTKPLPQPNIFHELFRYFLPAGRK